MKTRNVFHPVMKYLFEKYSPDYADSFLEQVGPHLAATEYETSRLHVYVITSL